MFVEPSHRRENGPGTGWIEIICGSMFSGKTEELIRRVRRALIAQQTVGIYKPTVDQRYSKKKIISHDENKIKSEPVGFATDILIKAHECEVVGIDEAQFFDDTLVDVVTSLANQGKRVIIAGLDMDYLGKPFSPMDQLMSIAEYITKVHAICMNCGNVASYTYRRTNSDKQVVLGAKDHYEALCRRCFHEKASN